MEYTISKHAKGMYQVTVHQICWKLSEPTWLPMSNLFKFPEYKDLRKEINMKEDFTHSDEVVTYEFKTSLENFEIIIDILSDSSYYDLTDMKELLEDIKLLEK